MSTFTSRPLDLVYTLFFLVHIPATLLLDLQAIYPKHLVPSALASLQEWYIDFSGDPLISGMARGLGNSELRWFQSFVYLEMLFQLPTFIFGAKALIEGKRSIYPLLCVYGASTATTTYPCLLYITDAGNAGTITTFQYSLLLSSYIPFFLIPLVMAVDMGYRLSSTVSEEKLKKT
ncbi:hypothetical protein Moror_17376 [Moniliophthora roreri MCA 2997]|uniref:Efficient mitochondria targeting-associated protein 19 n=2 Tax=Moniliophthora roreri TaxID=221103 RepID=V2XZ11_MONRO|nr:hypothetical protein Moror_17376 [Moniliophthora roreri MCA 2997]KAI3600466.1 hypothetical protein WG66_001824 [Moniliophthora roreri]